MPVTPGNQIDPGEGAIAAANRVKYAGMTNTQAMQAHINEVYKDDPAKAKLAWERWQNSLVAGGQPAGSRSAKQAQFMARRGMGLRGGIIDQTLYDKWAAKNPNQAKQYGGGAGLDRLFYRQHPNAHQQPSWLQQKTTRSSGFGDVMSALALGTIGVAAGPAVAASFGGGAGAGAGAATGLGTAGGATGLGQAALSGGIMGSTAGAGLGAGIGGAAAAGGGMGLGAADWISIASMAANFLGGKDAAGDAARNARNVENARIEGKRRISDKQLMKAFQQYFPGLMGGTPDDSAGGLAVRNMMQLLSDPGRVSPVAYERAQEQNAKALQTNLGGIGGAFFGRGFDPNSGLGQAMAQAAVHDFNAGNNEANRDFTLMGENLRRQDITTASQMLQNYLNQIFGLQQNRAQIVAGLPVPTSQPTPSPYNNLGDAMGMLSWLMANDRTS